MTRIIRVVCDDNPMEGITSGPLPPRQQIDDGYAKCIVCGVSEKSERPGPCVCDCCRDSIRTVELGAPMVFAKKDSQVVAVDFNPQIGLG